MIQCTIEQHLNASTIKHDCVNCGKANVRCFGNGVKYEAEYRTCWECRTHQPSVLNMVYDQQERINYYKTGIPPRPRISGLY